MSLSLCLGLLISEMLVVLCTDVCNTFKISSHSACFSEQAVEGCLNRSVSVSGFGVSLDDALFSVERNHQADRDIFLKCLLPPSLSTGC